MSAYPQQQQFGGPVYPQHHHQAVYNGYGYAQPTMDPHTFRQYYASQLATLTVNSRPIIQHLSHLASEYQRMSHIVAQCLESHIRVVPPLVKLPALYLLDAIAKNITIPYASAFEGPVVRIFTEAYDSVDSQTQSKMEEMLHTWRNGGLGNRELFGRQAQKLLENFVAERRHSSRQPVAAPVTQRPLLTKGNVLAEIDVMTAQKQHSLAGGYNDTVANQLGTLRELREVVRTSDLSQEDFTSIITQLRSLNQAVPVPQLNLTTLQAPVVVPPVTSIPPLSNISITPELRAYLGQLAPAPAPQPQVPVAHPLSKPLDVTSILATLAKAGVLPASNTASKDSTPPLPVDPEKLAFKRYEHEVLSLRIHPTTQDMARQQPKFLPYIYGWLTLQCKQCAIRFRDGPAGKQQMNDHLDLHYRQNSAQMNGRGHSRSWFLGAQHWLKDKTGKGKGRDDSPANAALEKQLKLQESFVVVPPGDEGKTVTCSVCAESLHSEFKEDDEDWVWKNAVSVNGKIFHATCYADAASGAVVAKSILANIKKANRLRSRSATPEVKSERPLTPLNPSSKRKASGPDGPDSTLLEPEGTPPSKRSLLSA